MHFTKNSFSTFKSLTPVKGEQKNSPFLPNQSTTL